MKRKIAVLGSNGMLGHAISSYFKRHDWIVVPVTRQEFDVLKTPISVLEEILFGLDAVVNCIGLTKPTIDAYSMKEAMMVNARFPVSLAKYCNKHNIKCFHVTTDCVFSGKAGKYTESDYMDADDIYGISKAFGDGADCMVLRTSIIGEEKIHKRYLLSWAIDNKGKSVLGFINHFWNGVTTVYLAEIIYDILSLDNMYIKGIHHIYSPDVVSKRELLELISIVYGLDLTIKSFECEVKCNRTLSTKRHYFKQYPRSLDLQLREMKRFFSSYAN